MDLAENNPTIYVETHVSSPIKESKVVLPDIGISEFVDLKQMSLETEKLKIFVDKTISFDDLPKIFTSFNQKYEDLRLELHPKNPERKNKRKSEEFVDNFT